MTKVRHYILFILTVIILVCLGLLIFREDEKPAVNENIYDLEKILKRKKIIATTDYTSTNYFIYNGFPMGFQYELLQSFAKFLKVDLELRISTDLALSLNDLIYHRSDIIALDLTVTRDRAEVIDFTHPYNQTRQVLVQRKPENWQNLSDKELEKQLLRNQTDLANKTIYIQKHSAYYKRLKSLSDEIGAKINIVESDEYETEQLITLVAKGEIDYTVCDEHVGYANQNYYPNIDIKTAISLTQNLAWAVRKGSAPLLDTLNFWLDSFKTTKDYKELYTKYFLNKKSTNRNMTGYSTLKGGKISPYDNLIKKYSKTIDWDWRLIASLIFHESRFQNNAVSWAGAFGLMQMMPVTAAKFGAYPGCSPEENIKAGVKYIDYLDKMFINDVPDKEERISFILASYAVGPGHITDAMALAKKYGKNPVIWKDNVETYLILKAMPRYYKDPVVEYGYCRGDEVCQFVFEVFDIYQQYKNVVK
jgi:membrane-bound lytic murein transglycosylase F